MMHMQTGLMLIMPVVCFVHTAQKFGSNDVTPTSCNEGECTAAERAELQAASTSHGQQQQMNNWEAQTMASKVAPGHLAWSRPALGSTCAANHLVSRLPCENVTADCLSCRFNTSCVYGAQVDVLCRPADHVQCAGERLFNKTMRCAFCYQTPSWQHDCSLCDMMLRGKKYYKANCTVHENVLCLGRRTFHKRLFCKWTKGDRWSTALTLSIVLGGFGVDRFYLGHWQEGIGKFFSFGGLGVWTLIDVVLIAIGYLSPADGSLYIT